MKTVNRIITPILSLLLLPAAFFLPIFRIYIASGLTGAGADARPNLLDNFGLSEFISIFDIVKLAKSGAADSMGVFKSLWDAIAGDKKQEIIDMLPGLHWGIIFLVFFVIVIILALALAIVTAATKKPLASVCLSLAGIVSAFIMNACFNGFAKPFLNGAFNLNSILGNTNQLLGVLLGNVATFEYMKLGLAYTAFLLIFICTLILSVTALMEQRNEG